MTETMAPMGAAIGIGGYALQNCNRDYPVQCSRPGGDYFCRLILQDSSSTIGDRPILRDDMADSIKLTLGFAVTPRTRALFDGTVRPAGIDLRAANSATA
jgi:hypothetical protein